MNPQMDICIEPSILGLNTFDKYPAGYSIVLTAPLDSQVPSFREQ